ncbi:MAG: FtsX-like permease family protein [Myxococcales bacterium]|nr:FtsX-like permease family protein [Myxococcales bacterium]
MWTSLGIAWREIRNHASFSLFFALNLAVGFSGFVALDAFQRSVSGELAERSRAFLGADLAVTSSRPLRAEEIERFDALAPPGARVARVAELFSMLAVGTRSRLVELHAIDGDFPLRGAIALAGKGPVGPRDRATLREQSGIWIDPALRSQLGLEVGARVRLGGSEFVVQGVVAQDGGRVSSGFSMAPRAYVAWERLEETGLIALGSRVRHRRLYASDAGPPVAQLADEMRRERRDLQLQVRSHEEATQDLIRTFGAVGRYLGLVSLVAIFLACLGSAHLFRAFLVRRLREVAILLSLGASRSHAQLAFLLQLVLLSSLAALFACGLGRLLLPLLADWAGDLAPADFRPEIGLETLALTALIASLGSVSACLPLLVRLRGLRPAELFVEHASPGLERGRAEALTALPALGFVLSLAVWRAESLWIGGLFTALFVAAGVLWVALALLMLRVFDLRSLRASLSARIALRELVRARAGSVSIFVAIALCTFLVGIPAQLQGVLERQLEMPERSKLPSLFLFDIQPDQVDSLSAQVARGGMPLERVSPMVRARLVAVKGEALQTESGGGQPSAFAGDDSEELRRLRVRRYNLSYRSSLGPGEHLLEGRDFDGSYRPERGEPAEMSLEADFADSLGLGIGDTLRFDVQGVPVLGKVVNLRDVQWNSFQPNFFVIFQPGVLEAAPAVFLASLPQVSTEERDALRESLVRDFPNVSVVDVSRAVRRILGLAEQLHFAIASTAGLSLLVGLLLVYTIASARARERRWETNLLKVLGADFSRIRRVMDLEAGLLAGCAVTAGSVGSVLGAAALSHGVFEITFLVSWWPVLGAILFVPMVCVLTARGATRKVLRERPLILLRAS